MNRKGHGFSKLVAMIGGFLILAGIILMGIAVLASLGYLNVGMMLENKYVSIFATAMIVVGLLDTITAVVIARW